MSFIIELEPAPKKKFSELTAKHNLINHIKKTL